jgi:hypothetical protein
MINHSSGLVSLSHPEGLGLTTDDGDRKEWARKRPQKQLFGCPLMHFEDPATVFGFYELN